MHMYTLARQSAQFLTQRERESDMSSVNQAPVLSVASNLFFWVPAYDALFNLGYYTLGSIAALVPITSGTYHGCKSGWTACPFGFPFLKAVDFYFAELFLPLLALHLIHWPKVLRPLHHVLIILVAFVMALLKHAMGPEGDMTTQAIVGGFSAVLLTGYWAGYAIYRKRIYGKAAFPPYNWWWLTAGLVMM
jgi:hypothetical protein